jgi:putative serine protease PepD
VDHIDSPGNPNRIAGRIGRASFKSLAAGLVASVVLAGGGFALAWNLQEGSGLSPASAGARTVSLTTADESPPASSLTGIVKRVLPAVVNIKVTTLTATPFGGTGSGRAEGSGIVLSKDGIILTNNHVVANSTSVSVSFNDGHPSMTGRVIGTDPQHDLAIVEVKANDLHPITIGSSHELRLGDHVAAIGFPLGLGGPTVTQGIVSGLDRDITVASDSGTGAEHLKGLIQTDAAINPGNSGGPLVDANGNLVGIATAAASAASAENTGFAIAVDEAIPVVEQIIRNGSTNREGRAWIGVQVAPVAEAGAAGLDLPPGIKGALVAGIVAGSPAASSSLHVGDVITSVDGDRVSSPSELTSILGGHSTGDTITIGVVRSGGERSSVRLTLGRRPATLQG